MYDTKQTLHITRNRPYSLWHMVVAELCWGNDFRQEEQGSWTDLMGSLMEGDKTLWGWRSVLLQNKNTKETVFTSKHACGPVKVQTFIQLSICGLFNSSNSHIFTVMCFLEVSFSKHPYKLHGSKWLENLSIYCQTLNLSAESLLLSADRFIIFLIRMAY